jgi:hypothetical protein
MTNKKKLKKEKSTNFDERIIQMLKKLGINSNSYLEQVATKTHAIYQDYVNDCWNLLAESLPDTALDDDRCIQLTPELQQRIEVYSADIAAIHQDFLDKLQDCGKRFLEDLTQQDRIKENLSEIVRQLKAVKAQQQGFGIPEPTTAEVSKRLQ